MKYNEQIKHPFWQKKRLEIMNRDNFTCQFCDSKNKQLNIHHLIYISKTLIWDYDNELLITLCKDCHSEIHELNKIIAIIAKNVIKQKIDLIELDNIILNYEKEKN